MGDTVQGRVASDPHPQQPHLQGEGGQVRIEYGIVAAVLAAVAILMLTVMNRSIQDIAEAFKLLF